MNGGTNGYWKWIAAIIAAGTLGGLPGYIYLYVHAPKREEVTFVRDRQEVVLQRLAVLELEVQRLREDHERLLGRR